MNPGRVQIQTLDGGAYVLAPGAVFGLGLVRVALRTPEGEQREAVAIEFLTASPVRLVQLARPDSDPGEQIEELLREWSRPRLVAP